MSSRAFEEKYQEEDEDEYDGLSKSHALRYKNPFRLPADEEVFTVRITCV